jgi:hypothetical protein
VTEKCIYVYWSTQHEAARHHCRLLSKLEAACDELSLVRGSGFNWGTVAPGPCYQLIIFHNEITISRVQLSLQFTILSHPIHTKTPHRPVCIATSRGKPVNIFHTSFLSEVYPALSGPTYNPTSFLPVPVSVSSSPTCLTLLP